LRCYGLWNACIRVWLKLYCLLTLHIYVYFISCVNGFQLEISLADIIIIWIWYFLNKISNAISNPYIIKTIDSLNCIYYCDNVYNRINGCAGMKEEDQVSQDSSADLDIYEWEYMLPSYEILIYLICLLLPIYFSLLCICLLYCV
jgi:hypothetical protein